MQRKTYGRRQKRNTEKMEITGENDCITEGDMIRVTDELTVIVKEIISGGDIREAEYEYWGAFQDEIDELRDDVLYYYPENDSTLQQLEIVKNEAKRSGQYSTKIVKSNYFSKEAPHATILIKNLMDTVNETR